MSKYIALSLIITSIFFSNCGSEDHNTSENTASQEKDTLSDTLTQSTDSIVLISNGYDLNPEVNLVTTDADSDVKYANIYFFSGKISDQNVELVIIRDEYNTEVFEGQFFNLSTSSTFTVQGKRNNTNDSLYLQSLAEASAKSTIKGFINNDNRTFSGSFISPKDTSHFKLQEVVRTPLQRELFLNITDVASFINTTTGLVCAWQEEVDFNDFMAIRKDGNGYDFGEEWITEDESIFFLQEGFVFTDVTITNTISTKFKEGHEPSGPDDEEYIAEGVLEEAHINFTYSWIENGELKEDSFEMFEDYLCTSWLMQDKIIIMKDNVTNGYPEPLYTFYWDNDLKEYVRR
jgi:hypothetical protein